MADLNDSVTLEMCIEKLNTNKKSYGSKGLDMQIYFVACLFNTSYNEILKKMQQAETK